MVQLFTQLRIIFIMFLNNPFSAEEQVLIKKCIKCILDESLLPHSHLVIRSGLYIENYEDVLLKLADCDSQIFFNVIHSSIGELLFGVDIQNQEIFSWIEANKDQLINIFKKNRTFLGLPEWISTD